MLLCFQEFRYAVDTEQPGASKERSKDAKVFPSLSPAKRVTEGSLPSRSAIKRDRVLHLQAVVEGKEYAAAHSEAATFSPTRQSGQPQP